MIYLNNQQVIPTLFSDNTSQIWKLPNEILSSTFVEIDWEFSHEGEFLHLAQLKHLLDANSVKSHLTLKYLPYARQDKEVSNISTFALRTFANLLNSLNFNNVAINDPHSKVALELIDNSYAYYPKHQIQKILTLIENDLVVYPDDGAVSKYSTMYPFKYIFGHKTRDQLTGNIIKYILNGDPKNKNILIIDDICDGGMTFKLLTKELLDSGAKEVNLFVTHGIFSKGLRTLKEAGIKRIFTSDGEVSENQNGFTYRRL